jgi:hypothetical protein
MVAALRRLSQLVALRAACAVAALLVYPNEGRAERLNSASGSQPTPAQNLEKSERGACEFERQGLQPDQLECC